MKIANAEMVFRGGVIDAREPGPPRYEPASWQRLFISFFVRVTICLLVGIPQRPLFTSVV